MEEVPYTRGAEHFSAQGHLSAPHLDKQEAYQSSGTHFSQAKTLGVRSRVSAGCGLGIVQGSDRGLEFHIWA